MTTYKIVGPIDGVPDAAATLLLDAELRRVSAEHPEKCALCGSGAAHVATSALPSAAYFQIAYRICATCASDGAKGMDGGLPYVRHRVRLGALEHRVFATQPGLLVFARCGAGEFHGASQSSSRPLKSRTSVLIRRYL